MCFDPLSFHRTQFPPQKGRGQVRRELEQVHRLTETAWEPTQGEADGPKVLPFLTSFVQRIEALSLLLDSSPYYGTLCELPEPDGTSPTATTLGDIQSAIDNSLPVLQEIIQLTEEDEKGTIRQEIQKRRTRLGAPPLEVLKGEVKREIWAASKVVIGSSLGDESLIYTKLESLYLEVLAHPRTSDDLRRSTEACLLQRKSERLLTLAGNDPEKESLRSEILEMVNGIILLKIPNELAWSIYFETLDLETLGE